MLQQLDFISDEQAREIIAHLCGDACHGVGQSVELCESRGDCVIVVTCDGCGKQTQVPFNPTNGKPVYCRECYSARRSQQAY